jgi:hypothetical protein
MWWYCAVRPAHFSLMVLRKLAGLPPAAVRLGAPIARGFDSLAVRVRQFPYRPVKPNLAAEELTAAKLLPLLEEIGDKRWLRPAYTLDTLEWTLRRAAALRRTGDFRAALLRTDTGKVAGWYMYYLNPAGVSPVIQLHAAPAYAPQTVDHLLYSAWSEGATVLGGKLETSRHLTQVFSERHFVFHCGPQWASFHSRRPEIVNAIQRGEAFLSRLEGEWISHFR